MKAKTTRIVFTITITAYFLAINVALSSFGLPVPGGHLYLNDIAICIASLLLGPFEAFLVGGVGAFIGDVLFYPTPMFVSLVTHGLQAIAISLISRYVLKKHPYISAAIALTVGAVIMIVGYSLGRAFIYSTPEYALLKLPFQVLQAAVGAVVGFIVCYPLKIRKIFLKYLERNVQIHE